MAQHRCELCGAQFDTFSEYRRHRQTSHPERAPSASDLESVLSGITYPASRDALAQQARDRNKEEIANIFEEFPDRDYQDAADVARAFGRIRAHEEKPTNQPSVEGGKAAMQTEKISAAQIASLFSGLDFPASVKDLKSHAQSRASDREMELLSNLPDHSYGDMSDVAKAFGEVKKKNRE